MNSIVQHFRSQFPDDTRSDDEITLAYASKFDPAALESQFPDFTADYRRIVSAAFPPTAGDYVKQAASALVRGATGTLASALESPAILAQELGRRSERTFDPTQKAEPFEEASGIPDLARRAGESVSPDPVEALQGSFLASKLPGAFGSTIGLAAGAVSMGAARIPATLGVALLGASTQSAEGYKDALRHGASSDQALRSYILNAPAGGFEAFPLGKMLNRINTMSGGTFTQSLKLARNEGLQEAITETLQGISGDIIALNYDKDRKLFGELAEDAAAGGISGAVFSLLTSALGSKLGRMRTAPEGREEPSTPAAVPLTPVPDAAMARANALRSAYDAPFAAANLEPPDEAETPIVDTVAPAQPIGLAGIFQAKGATDALYVKIFEALSNGKDTVSGIKDPILPKLKPYYDNGQIKSPADAKAIVESGILEKPIKEVPNPDWRVTVQSPLGEGDLGYVQIDEDPNWSMGPDKLRAQGYEIPDFSKLSQGRYTYAQAVEKLAEQTIAPPAQEPAPTRFETVKDILDFRKKRIAEEISLYEREIGLTNEEARRLQSLMSRDASTAKLERQIGEAKAKRLNQFFDESPYNKVGGPFEFWESDNQFNPESADAEDDVHELALAIVSAIDKGVEMKATSDRFLYAAIAAKKLTEKGGTKSHIARALDRFTMANSGSQGDKAEYFKSLGRKINEFLAAQGIDLPQGDLQGGLGGASPAASLTAPGPAPATFAGYDGFTARFTLTEPIGAMPAGTVVSQEQLAAAGYDVAPQLAALRYNREQLAAQQAYFFKEIADLKAEIEGFKGAPTAKTDKTISRLAFVQRKFAELDSRTRAGDLRQLHPDDVDTFELPFDVERSKTGKLIYPAFFQVGDGSNAAAKLSGAKTTRALGDILTSGARAEKEKKRHETKRLTAFKAKDGSVILLGTYKNAKGQFMVADPAASVATEESGVSLEEILEQGYKPISSIRTAFPMNRPVFRFANVEAFKAEFADEAVQTVKAARDAAAALEQDIKQAGLDRQEEAEVVEAVEEAEEATEDVILDETEKFKYVPGLSAATSMAVDKYLTDANGYREVITEEKLATAIEDAANQDPSFQSLVRLATNRNVKAYRHLFKSIYEAYKATENIVENEERLAAFQAALSGQSQISETDVADPLWRRTVETANAQGGYTDSGVILRTINRLFDRLTVAGVNVAVFQQRLNAVRGDFFGEVGAGLQSSANNLIAIVADDVTNPSQEVLTAALHETVHFLSAGLPAETQAKVHAAIQKMSDSALGLGRSADPRIRSGTATAEERLAEYLALKGVSDQTGFVAKVMRFLRDLYLRVSMAVQQAILGEDHLRPETVLAWLQNRLETFANGGLADALPARFGGYRPSLAQRVAFYKPLAGSQWERAVLNWRTGEVEYAELTPSTVEAAMLNAQFRRQDVRAGPEPVSGEGDPTVRAGIDIAAQNELFDTFTGMYNAWKQATPSTKTQQQFAMEVLGYEGDYPSLVISGHNAALQMNGNAAAPTGTRVKDLQSDKFKGEAALKAISLQQGLTDYMSVRREVLDGVNGEIQVNERKLAKGNQRLLGLATNFQALDQLFSTTLEDMRDQFTEFRRDLRGQQKLNKKYGSLLQAVKELQIRQEDQVPPSHETLIESALQTIAASPIKFMDALRAVSQLNINWQNTPLINIGGAIGIRDQIRIAATANPQIQFIAADNDILAIAAAFARDNDAYMARLNVREMKLDAEAKLIDAMIRQAFTDTTDDLSETRKNLNKVVTLKAQATRIFEAIKELRRGNKTLLVDINRDKAFVAAHDVSRGTLDANLSRMQAVVGVAYPVQCTHEEAWIIPRGPNATLSELQQSVQHFTVKDDAGQQARQLDGWIRSFDAWLKANPQHAGGKDYARIAEQRNRAWLLSANTRHIGIRRTHLSSFLGTIGEWYSETGTASGRAVQRRINQFVGFLQGFTDRAVAKGNLAASAKGSAMKALGIRDAESFRTRFWHPACTLLDQRPDLEEPSGGPAAVRAAKLNAIRDHLTADPGTRHLITTKGWESLRKYYIAQWEANAEQNKIQSELPSSAWVWDDRINAFRRPVGSESTVSRHYNGQILRLYHSMIDLWGGTKLAKLTAQSAADAWTQDPQGFEARLKAQFTPDIWRNFVRPMAYRAGRAMFSGDRRADGSWSIADRSQVIAAFEKAKGDVVAFALALKTETGSQVPDAEFIGETLDTFQQMFNDLHGNLSADKALEQKDRLQPLNVMNARVASTAPAEWVEYTEFDQNQARVFVHNVAYAGAFGRGAEAVDTDMNAAQAEVQDAASLIEGIKLQVVADNPAANFVKRDQLIKAEVKRRGLDWTLYSNAEEHLDRIRSGKKKFHAWFEVNKGGLPEMRSFMEALHTMTGLMVQSLKSAMVDQLSLFNPLITVGVNRVALGQIKNNFQAYASSAFGSFSQLLPASMHWNAEAALLKNDLGHFDISGVVPIRDRIRAIWTTDSGVAAFFRGAREILTQTGIGGADGQDSFKILHAPFTQLSGWQHSANIWGNWKTFERLILRGVEHLKKNPQYVGQRDYQFTAKDLKYKRRFILDDERAFHYLVDRLSQHAMTLEGVANDIVARQIANPNDKRLFTKTQMQNLAAMAMSEISGEAAPNARPTWMANPVIRASSLLMGWSFQRMDQLRKGFREPNGEWSRYAMFNGFKMLTAILPVGLAAAWLMDEWDEEVVGKKSNIRGFGQDNNFLAAVEQVSRTGTLGMWGDALNTLGNFGGTGDLRGLSIDNRVVFVNSTLNMFRALGAWMAQGEATYSTVYRPMMQAIGGSGYMQTVQILNHALDLDNPEARVTRRINAQNYLRAAGRELNLDVRLGRGGNFALPNPIRPHLGEMFLAALADDATDFRDAYGKAIEAAREEGKDDPEDSVKRSFAASSPLRTVFVTPPSEREYRQILSILSSDGQLDVSEAVLLFNRYAGKLGIREFVGKKPKPVTLPSIQSLRARAFVY